MLAPLYESVPPTQYGGTERVVYYLVEELVARGHDVTLFASGGSRTSARLIEASPRPVELMPRLTDAIGFHLLQLGMAFDRADEFDVIHSHCDFRAFPFGRLTSVPVLNTCHNRLDSPELQALARAYPEAAVTALSRNQQRQLPAARWLGVCHNGIPVDKFPFAANPGNYLAFVGRVSPEKGPVAAIEAARQVGMPLKIAAKINCWEEDYFEAEIKSRLDPPEVEFVGQLDELTKREFLAGAAALLFPISWPEPFGMVMIEAMASGTPVLAYPVGSVPEVVDPGITGFLCRDVDELAARVDDAINLDRAACRAQVATRFSASAMADAYEAAYRRLLASDSARRGSAIRRLAS
ncbi:MAG TPA: glycosyltransferase family 4 protein [Chloroflexota bacterium]|nr:glycosyltransferase family 4 protein [Chloroflexota bacterium]